VIRPAVEHTYGGSRTLPGQHRRLRRRPSPATRDKPSHHIGPSSPRIRFLALSAIAHVGLAWQRLLAVPKHRLARCRIRERSADVRASSACGAEWSLRESRDVDSSPGPVLGLGAGLGRVGIGPGDRERV